MELEVKVEGMKCGGCSSKVEAALKVRVSRAFVLAPRRPASRRCAQSWAVLATAPHEAHTPRHDTDQPHSPHVQAMDHVKGVQVDLETKLATIEVEAPNQIDAMQMLPGLVATVKVRA